MIDLDRVASGLGGAPIPWTDEPWDRRYVKKRRAPKPPLDRAVVHPDRVFRERLSRTRWEDYDLIVVSFSGGKDSLAALFFLLDAGAPRGRIELWHQNVDGAHDAPAAMDWPVTRDYIESVAEVLGLPVLYQWRGGGLLGEVRRRGRHMYPIYFESPSRLPAGRGVATERAGRGGERTVYRWDTRAGRLTGRRGQPAVSDDLQQRWCSDVVKMEPFDKAILYDPRLQAENLGHRPRILVVTGERRREGKRTPITIVEPGGRRRVVEHLGGRAVYHQVEPHDTHAPTKRVVDHWRPVLNFSDEQVWDSLRRRGIRPHPAYELGPWGRCSCAGCIYSLPKQIAAWRDVLPDQFEQVARTDDELRRQGRMTWRQDVTLREFAGARSEVDPAALRKWLPYLRGEERVTPADVVVPPERWRLPAGASAGFAGGSTNVAARRPPGPVPPRGRMVPAEQTRRWQRQYRGTRGTDRSSRYRPPRGVPDYPVGTWRIDEHRGLYGRGIEELVELDPTEVEDREGMVETNEQGRGDDADRYADWMRRGLRPPPISVVQTESGALRVVDGHRRRAAAERAGRPIRAWVSWTVDGDAVDHEGRPVGTGLTWELAVRRGLVR